MHTFLTHVVSPFMQPREPPRVTLGEGVQCPSTIEVFSYLPTPLEANLVLSNEYF